jgi:hypothetical protein
MDMTELELEFIRKQKNKRKEMLEAIIQPRTPLIKRPKGKLMIGVEL